MKVVTTLICFLSIFGLTEVYSASIKNKTPGTEVLMHYIEVRQQCKFIRDQALELDAAGFYVDINTSYEDQVILSIQNGLKGWTSNVANKMLFDLNRHLENTPGIIGFNAWCKKYDI
jgi:hypothetical protein